MRSVFFIGLLLLSLNSTAVARKIYVDNLTGNDRNDGSTPDTSTPSIGPCRSIAKAIRIARNGDRIVVKKTSEPYRESLTLQGRNQSGSELSPFILQGNGATLDGSMPIPTGAWKHYSKNVFQYRPKLMSHQTLFIDNAPASRVQVTKDDQLAELETKSFAVKNGYIYFCCEEGSLPDGYNLSCSGMVTGITLFSCRNVLVQDLVIQGFQLDGVNAHDNVSNATVTGITARGNGRSGISVEGASRLKIEACLIGNNAVAQVRTDGFSKTEIVDSDLVDSDKNAPGILIKGGRVWRDSQPILAK